MKILYDHLGFLHRYGGVPKYYVEMLKYFNPEQFNISILFSNNYYLRDLKDVRCYPLFSNRNFKGKYTLLNILNKLYSIPVIFNGDYDIYHQTLYDTYALHCLPKSKIYVTTMHDLNYVKIPQYYLQSSFWKNFLQCGGILKHQQESAQKADHIISISNNTKNDLIDIWNIDPDKITVIYHGISEPLKNLPQNRLHEKPYLLYVGSREKYKNFENLVKSFSWLYNRDIDLVCTGIPFSHLEFQMLKDCHLDNKVYCYQASEYDMARLYRDALCFVYPSFYEGFGMPILEAMNYGCPVVLSNRSCFPEVAGDASLYFNPDDCEDIKNSIETVIYNDDFRSSLIKKGYSRVKNFSWKKTADEHIALYKRLLG